MIAYDYYKELSYNAAGELTICEDMDGPEMPAMIPNAATSAQENGILVTVEDEDAIFVMEIQNVQGLTMDLEDGPLEEERIAVKNFLGDLQLPDCSTFQSAARRRMEEEADEHKLQEKDSGFELDPVGNSTHKGRRLSGSTVSYLDAWKITQAAYTHQKTSGLPAGWSYARRRWSCKNVGESSVAKIIQKSGTTHYGITFSGSDSLEDLSNGKAGSKSPIRQWNGATVRYVRSLTGCLHPNVPNKSVKFLFGHSLGGAAAVIYYRLGRNSHTLDNDVTVTTFGAPTTKVDGECTVPGHAWKNNIDVSCSDFYTGISGLNYTHELKGSTYKETSPRRRWASWGSPRRRNSWKWEYSSCEVTRGPSGWDNTFDVGFFLSLFHRKMGNPVLGYLVVRLGLLDMVDRSVDAHIGFRKWAPPAGHGP